MYRSERFPTFTIFIRNRKLLPAASLDFTTRRMEKLSLLKSELRKQSRRDRILSYFFQAAMTMRSCRYDVHPANSGTVASPLTDGLFEKQLPPANRNNRTIWAGWLKQPRH